MEDIVCGLTWRGMDCARSICYILGTTSVSNHECGGLRSQRPCDYTIMDLMMMMMKMLIVMVMVMNAHNIK